MILNREIISIVDSLKNICVHKCDEFQAMIGLGEYDRKLPVEIVFIRNVIADIGFVKDIPYKATSERFFMLILRNSLEQVILLKFLNARYKFDNTIFDDYMGININEEILGTEDEENFYDCMKELNGKRTKKYKPKFWEMSKEFEDINSKDSLYKVYGVIADFCHNSYYQDVCNFILNEENLDETNIQMYIKIILYSLLAEFKE